MNIKPTKARVLVRERETLGIQTEGNLLVARARKAEQCDGEVLAVGPEVPEAIPIGSTVTWRRMFGVDVGDNLTMLQYDHLDTVEVPE